MMRRIVVCALAIAALTAVGSASSGAASYEGVAVEDGGIVRGAVRYAGTPPPPATIAITKDTEACGREKIAANLLVGPDKGIENAVVRLVDIRRGKPLPPPATVRMRQKGCEYTPHVVVFPAGSRVRIENDDGILHNINTTSEKNPSFTIAQPKYRRVVDKRIEEPEMPIRVRCDVHSWMGAWWISQEHPYYALTDTHGAFTLTDVPPGTCTLEAWHETLGKVTRSVTVTPKAVVVAAFEMTKR